MMIDFDIPTGCMEYYLLFDMAFHQGVEFTNNDIKMKKNIMKSYFIDSYKMTRYPYYQTLNKKIFDCIVSGDTSYFHTYKDFHDYIWKVRRPEDFTLDPEVKARYLAIIKLYTGKN
jgi:uncharacterized protein (UPF0297 family)